MRQYNKTEKLDRLTRLQRRQHPIDTPSTDKFTQIELENGDLFIMTTQMQQSYTHEVATGTGIRVCLNFRKIIT
jgi:alkylated DNA repair dioxygenase AlkB